MTIDTRVCTEHPDGPYYALDGRCKICHRKRNAENNPEHHLTSNPRTNARAKIARRLLAASGEGIMKKSISVDAKLYGDTPLQAFGGLTFFQWDIKNKDSWTGVGAAVPQIRPSAEDRALYTSFKRSLSMAGWCLQNTPAPRKPSTKNTGPRIFKTDDEFISMCKANGWKCLSCLRPYGEWHTDGTRCGRVTPEQMHALRTRAEGGTHEDVVNGCYFCNKHHNSQRGFTSIEAFQEAGAQLWAYAKANEGWKPCAVTVLEGI